MYMYMYLIVAYSTPGVFCVYMSCIVLCYRQRKRSREESLTQRDEVKQTVQEEEEESESGESSSSDSGEDERKKKKRKRKRWDDG